MTQHRYVSDLPKDQGGKGREVVLGVTNEPRGYAFVSVREADGLGSLAVSHLSPEVARSVAFSLLDFADLAEFQADANTSSHPDSNE